MAGVVSSNNRTPASEAPASLLMVPLVCTGLPTYNRGLTAITCRSFFLLFILSRLPTRITPRRNETRQTDLPGNSRHGPEELVITESSSFEEAGLARRRLACYQGDHVEVPARRRARSVRGTLLLCRRGLCVDEALRLALTAICRHTFISLGRVHKYNKIILRLSPVVRAGWVYQAHPCWFRGTSDSVKTCTSARDGCKEPARPG